ncbi:hypothetical protein IFM89_015299 [Coptis chinensis]|uniref:DUF538 domain-containing protein n=1 Tax=Coptis chinensis TaxID=261450 RepID=A0A835M915_9MAGN|nr:hypothetical protein IFM89_015299 [Coptis chinensis]
MSLVTEEIKAKAEVYYGAEICGEKGKLLLEEMGLPNGILPLDNIEECGYAKDTGFFWFKRKERKEFYWQNAGKLVCYDPEVTGYVEKSKIKKMKGIKSKELSIWISISEVSVKNPPTAKVTFKGTAGLFMTYPLSYFVIQEEKNM